LVVCSAGLRPFTAGDITEDSIDCPYETMLTAESLSLFGQQLKRRCVKEFPDLSDFW
jgi:hypothetical protein